MESAIIGLSVIIIGWIIQLMNSWNGDREIKKRFLILYGVGAALLIIDAYINQLTYTAFFNLVVLVLVMATLIRIGSVRSKSYVSRSAKKKKI